MLGYKVQGAGKKIVVMLHDWLGDHTNYEAVRPYLDESQFTWIFPDLRGYGSSRHIAGNFTLAEACGDVIELMDHLEIEKFAVVGHSMTGMIVFRLGLNHPNRVTHVVGAAPVTASGLKLDDAGRAFFEAAAVTREACRDVVAAVTGARYASTWLDHKAQRAAETSTEAARLGYLRNMLLVSDFSSEVGALKAPVLAITGSHDADGFKQAMVRAALKESLSNVQYEDVLEAGHYPMQEAPVQYASILQAFLA